MTTKWEDIWQNIKDQWGDESSESELLAIRTANRVLRDWRRKLDLESVIRIESISYVEDFKNYLSPSDIKAGAIIGFRKKDNQVIIPFQLVSPWRFSQLTSGEYICRQIDKGIEYFSILHNPDNSQKVVLHTCDAITEWTASGDASNLTLDEVDQEEGSGCLNFDVSGTTATLTAAITTAVDISDLGEKTLIRLLAKFPSISNITSITFRWGSDASNYWTQTITTQVDGRPFKAGEKNELELKRQSATQVGTPDDEAIDYLLYQINFSASVTNTDFRIDNIVAYKPEDIDLEYYSYNTVKDADDAWQDGFTVSVVGAAKEVPLIYDEWIPGFEADILYYLLNPEEDTRRKEFLEIANSVREDIKNNFPSRKMRPKRKWLLPKIPSV